MNIRLISKPDKNISPLVQVCLNRNIPIDNIRDYLSCGNAHINPATAFDEGLLEAAARRLIKTISRNGNICIIVDSDVDGLTSSAILINYLYSVFPAYALKHIDWRLHSGKQHGLADHIDDLLNCSYDLVICPDSATNDIKEIELLHDIMTEVIILDHHLSDVPFSEYAITINSQYNYPNPQLSGAGVVWQFCRYLDTLLGKNVANDFIDLCSIGNMGDMMDITVLETKEIIFQGLTEEALKNPLIYGLATKNAFALSKPDYLPSNRNGLQISPMGAAFFIIPLLNAICRSGTMEEKELIFKAMLTMTAFEQIPSNKRGHKLGEMERVVDQALRTCTNVKNRQTRAEEAGLQYLENLVPAMIDNKVFVFENDGTIDRNIAGLVANKMMAKYQRPVCVVSPLEDGTYAGSMRGYTKTGISSFKDIADTSSNVLWTRGHENAAGICLSDVQSFVQDMNSALENVSTDIVYYVDYIFNADNIDPNIIFTLTECNDYLGTGFERPYVYIENIKLDNLQIMKSNTIKLSTSSGVDIMMFGASDEFIEELSTFKGTLNAVCKPARNEWMGNIKPQLMIVDYELVKPTGLIGWGF